MLSSLVKKKILNFLELKSINLISSYFADDLKHILGSETTKLGLTNFYEMLQHQTLNKRLILILLDRILTAALPTDNLTKHVMKK